MAGQMTSKAAATFASVALKYYTQEEFGRGVALALGGVSKLTAFDTYSSLDATQAKHRRARLI